MIREIFRPWGRFDLILNQIQVDQWSFIGAVSTEDRCTAAFKALSERSLSGESLVFRFEDAFSRFSDDVNFKTNIKQTEFISIGLPPQKISHHKLLGPHGAPIQELINFISSSTLENLVIDISSLPKKIFFLLIRKVLDQPVSLKNIIVTYSEPGSYCKDSLAENPEAWNALPGFLSPFSEPNEKVLVIGMGYELLGLPDLYSSGMFNEASTHLLFPFPSSRAGASRNWDFARLLEPVPGNTSVHINRMDARNVPDIFDKLVYLSNHGQKYTILAPFGPKPMSLGMCLFASAFSNGNSVETRPSVFYTQPTVYNPDYSSGVKMVDGVEMINAYCIRLNGVNLYSSDNI